jgi:hypothetical protein
MQEGYRRPAVIKVIARASGGIVKKRIFWHKYR